MAFWKTSDTCRESFIHIKIRLDQNYLKSCLKVPSDKKFPNVSNEYYYKNPTIQFKIPSPSAVISRKISLEQFLRIGWIKLDKDVKQISLFTLASVRVPRV